MACSGCAARRAWIKKMAKLAYERAFGRKVNSGHHGTDGGDQSPR